MAGLEQHTKFHKEVMAGDLIVVQSEILEIKTKTVRYHHHMFNVENGKELASTEFLTVHLDTQSRKAVPFPEEIVEKVQKILSFS